MNRVTQLLARPEDVRAKALAGARSRCAPPRKTGRVLRRTAVTAGLSLLFLAPAFSQALAADWRYCLAQDPADHRVMVSQPFQSSENLTDLEASFNTWLTKSGMRHEWGICPRSNGELAVSSDRQSAIQYNKTMQLTPVEVSWPHG